MTDELKPSTRPSGTLSDGSLETLRQKYQEARDLELSLEGGSRRQQTRLDKARAKRRKIFSEIQDLTNRPVV